MSMFCASPPPVSPCYGELSPYYGEIISLLLSCSACTRAPPNFAQPIVIQIDFPAKTGPETANSPCFPPVIREYQGESGLEAPLDDPAEFASPQARMEPRPLEMCECGSAAGEGDRAKRGGGARASTIAPQLGAESGGLLWMDDDRDFDRR